jgi:hypothetical protein
MPSPAVFIDEPDNDIQPKAKLGDIEAENISPFSAARVSTHAPKATYRLNKHDRVVVGALPGALPGAFPQIVHTMNFALIGFHPEWGRIPGYAPILALQHCSAVSACPHTPPRSFQA